MHPQSTVSIPTARPAHDWRIMWLIARRAAIESLRDRTTVLTSMIFVIILPAVLVFAILRPMAVHASSVSDQISLGWTIAVYLLIVGLLPANGAVGIASGQFAGEKERGCLAPLLATPASNVAIFGGKVLGAVIPAVIYSALAELTFVVWLSVAAGPGTLLLIPLPVALSMLALVPGVAVLCAGVAALISSRVRTYNSAQQITSLVMAPLMAAIIAVALILQAWGPIGSVAVVLGIVAADILLITLSALTWRREEILARL